MATSGRRRGNVSREGPGWPWAEGWLLDFRYGIRALRKNPRFTVVAALTLALGIGASTAIFSIVDGVLLKSLPYPDPDRLVQVLEPSDSGRWGMVSPGVFLHWRAQSAAFDGLAVFTENDFVLTDAGDPERIGGLRISASGLHILGAVPLIGRIFAPDEDRPEKGKVVVLTHRLWKRRFGGDPAVVGHNIRLSSESYTVIGVLPPDFLPWNQPEFVVPYVFAPEEANNRVGHYLRVLGRLSAGVAVARAQTELAAISERSRHAYPVPGKIWGARVVPLHEQLTGGVKATLLLLLGAAGLVLLIACSNVANLLLAKASVRWKETALRAALGASRGRIVRQFLVEGLLLSLLGAILGVALAFGGVEILTNLSTWKLPRAQGIGIDVRVLGSALVVAVLTGLAFGLVPALQASRPNLVDALKDAARGSSGRSRFRHGLIVSEVALALVLSVGAGLLLTSFHRLSNVRPGFDPASVLTMQLALPEAKYPDAARRAAFFGQLIERVEAVPGVEVAGFAGSMPLVGGTSGTRFTINARTFPPAGGYPVTIDFCTSNYFRAMGIPLRQGRFFDERDSAASPRVALINEALAREHFPNGTPLGQSIRAANENWEIVGVVGDVRQRGLGEPSRPTFYRPPAFAPGRNGHLVVRTKVSPLNLAESVRGAILEVDPQQPVANVRTLENVLSGSVAQRRLILSMLGLFAGIALLLASVGLYGVIAYSATQRTREIGVRLALGASRGDVLGLVIGQGVKLTVIGIAVGSAGALSLTRVLASQLYETNPADPFTFVGVAAILLLVALLACVGPALRATQVDPTVALRAR